MSRVRLLVAGVALVLVAACGDSTSPTAPTRPTTPPIPQVAGTYGGPFEWRWDAVLVAQGTGSMSVVQAGAQLTLTASLTFDELTLQAPAITGTVNSAGFFTQTSAVDPPAIVPPCGLVTPTGFSLNFSGNTARLVETATTTECGNWEFSGILTRQQGFAFPSLIGAGYLCYFCERGQDEEEAGPPSAQTGRCHVHQADPRAWHARAGCRVVVQRASEATREVALLERGPRAPNLRAGRLV